MVYRYFFYFLFTINLDPLSLTELGLAIYAAQWYYILAAHSSWQIPTLKCHQVWMSKPQVEHQSQTDPDVKCYRTLEDGMRLYHSPPVATWWEGIRGEGVCLKSAIVKGGTIKCGVNSSLWYRSVRGHLCQAERRTRDADAGLTSYSIHQMSLLPRWAHLYTDTASHWVVGGGGGEGGGGGGGDMACFTKEDRVLTTYHR